jgi:hypothetical protein
MSAETIDSLGTEVTRTEPREYRKVAIVKAGQAIRGGVMATLEGDHTFEEGDYICGPGAGGEFWPVKRAIFEATYVPAGPPAESPTETHRCGDQAIDGNGYHRACMKWRGHDGPHGVRDTPGTPTGAAIWLWDEGMPATRFPDNPSFPESPTETPGPITEPYAGHDGSDTPVDGFGIVPGPTETPGLRAAAKAVIDAWDDKWIGCSGMAQPIEALRAALSLATPNGMDDAIAESMERNAVRARIAEVKRRQRGDPGNVTAVMVSLDSEDWACIDCGIPLEPGAPPICEECVDG